MKFSLLAVALLAFVLGPISVHAQFTGPDRQIENRTAVADTAVERMLAQRQMLRAGADPQAQESAIDPAHYILGPGDGVYLNVFAAHFLDQDLTVTPEGKLILPQTGEVNVAGLNISDAEAKVNRLLTREYKSPDAHLSLRRLRSMKVNVLGEVLYPGVQTLSGMVRVSEAISKAGDLTSHSSLRNIEIRRSDGSLKATADLKRYYVAGDLSANPVIDGGDVIFVPKVKGLVMINGAVATPGTYEFAEGDKLSTLIAIAGGALPSARFDSVELARFPKDNPEVAERSYIDFSHGNDIAIEEGDVISIRGYGQYHEPRVVAIGGEVEFPGRYPIDLGKTRIKDILQRAGGILSSGSLEEAVVLRRVGIGSYESDPELRMLEKTQFTTDKRVTDDQYNYYMARTRQLGRSVMVVNFKDLLLKGDESQNLVLRDRDSIWIPRARGYVSVLGSVANPGNVSYAEGRTYKEYIAEAGGYTSSADKGAVRVTNSKTGTYIDPSSDTHYMIGQGDTIVIPPERPTFWQDFQIITAVTAQIITIIAGILLLRK